MPIFGQLGEEEEVATKLMNAIVLEKVAKRCSKIWAKSFTNVKMASLT